MKLKARTALVTGASRGVGLRVALGLARQGARVLVHARRIESARRTAEAIVAEGGEAMPLAAELSDPREVERLADEVLEAGRLDILYNNAAIMEPWRPDLEDHRAEDWTAGFQVNVFAPVRLCLRLVPPMRERGWGRIVNVTSGIEKTPELSAYAASKRALDQFTDDLAVRLEGSGVIVSRLDPGWLRTDLGGPQADHDPDTVLPGALVPVLLPAGAPGGRLFRAQELRGAYP